MDLRQFNPGHALVVPKRHVVDILALEDATGAALMATIGQVARAVREAFRPDGINITASNGEDAGQEVVHLHFHTSRVTPAMAWCASTHRRSRRRRAPNSKRGQPRSGRASAPAVSFKFLS